MLSVLLRSSIPAPASPARHVEEPLPANSKAEGAAVSAVQIAEQAEQQTHDEELRNHERWHFAAVRCRAICTCTVDTKCRARKSACWGKQIILTLVLCGPPLGVRLRSC